MFCDSLKCHPYRCRYHIMHIISTLYETEDKKHSYTPIKKIVQIINNEMPQIHVQPVNIHPLWNNMTHSQTTNSSMDCTACTICKYLQIRVHIHQKFIYLQIRNAFSALTPLAWGRKGIRPVKNWVVGCWHGNLSGAMCRLAYGPADATATHCLLFQ